MRMKRKIIISSVILLISVVILLIPTIYLLDNYFVPSIDYLGSSLGKIFSMIPLYIIGTIGMVFSVKKLFELL
jgi:hypothetical protein